MTEILSHPTTALVLQVSPKETVTYEMPIRTYELFKDTCDGWPIIYGRTSKYTVERVLNAMDSVLTQLGLNIWGDIKVTRKPTKPGIKGLSAGVWYDEFALSEEGEEGEK